MNDKKLYLIDGYAFAYRAYYALIRSPLVNSKGFPTSAIYGFANYILQLFEIYDCPYIAVAMDSGKPTFRHDVYAEYKANREAMPDDLKIQMPYINELLTAFNIPIVKQDGFEADDVIASLTRKARSDGFEVFLVTKDKDLMQLVCPGVTMLAPDGSRVFRAMGEDEVFDKMGVSPNRISDYLALVGDASDNIPGVPGIGPKSAAKMLNTVSVAEILENPDVLETPKLIDKIKEYKDQLYLSKKLTELRFDVDLNFEMDYLKRENFDLPHCLSLLKEFEFFSMMKNPLFGTGTQFLPSVHIINTYQSATELVNKIEKKGSVSIDISVIGNLPRTTKLTGIAFALDSTETFYVCASGNEIASHKSDNISNELDGWESIKKILAPVLESDKIGKIGHNLKNVILALRREGLTLRGIAFDTMLAAYIIDPGKRQYDLSSLTHEQLGLNISVRTKDRATNIDGAPTLHLHIEEVDVGAAYGACAALLLTDKLKTAIDEKNATDLFDDIELSLEPILADLEWHGVLIDADILSQMSMEYGNELEDIIRDIYDTVGVEFNLNSPKQISQILFGRLGLTSANKKKKNGQQSTSVEVLEKLAYNNPIAQKILDYREKQKLLSTYIDALLYQILPETKRIHTTFNQAITATGRLSSASPNLQNIPVRTESGRRIREAFIAPSGYLLVSADYSQIELRVLAHLSCDPALISAFKDDLDIHTQTASAVYGVFWDMVTPEMRRSAKTINFGLIYGMGPLNLSKQLGVTYSEAKSFIESYFDQFPSIRRYIDASIQKTRRLGYSETLLGRRRYLPEINSTNRTVREAAERTAINTPVQGTAADIIKLAMIRIHSKLEKWPNAKMLLQVHDELVFETPEEVAENFSMWIKEEMSAAYQLKVPLKVDAGIGRHWGEAH